MSDSSSKNRWPTPLQLETNQYSPMDDHRHHPRYRMIQRMMSDYMTELVETDMDMEWDDWCDAHHKDYLEALVEAEQDGGAPRGHIKSWDWESLGL